MTSLRLAVFALLTGMLAGCIDITDSDQLKNMPTEQLCETYYFGRHPSVGIATNWPGKQDDVKKELGSRKAVAADEWVLIDQEKLQTGMSECGLKAAWGFPLRVTHTTTATGLTTHYMYTLTRQADIMDGKVTAFKY